MTCISAHIRERKFGSVYCIGVYVSVTYLLH